MESSEALKYRYSGLSVVDELENDTRFAPFVRRDVYGPMGRGQMSLTEKALLGIAVVTIVPIRLALAVNMVIFYYLICKVCSLGVEPHREDGQEDYTHVGGWRRAVIVRCGKFLSRVMFLVLGFWWIREIRCEPKVLKADDEVAGMDQHEKNERPGAIISNHVSYIDILYHTSSSFPSFVAKRSVANLPIFGLVSKCLGCIYVQRELKASDSKGVAGFVTKRIQEAHRNKDVPLVMLFPEGTTTDGDFLLPFKTGAFLAKAPVLPVILRYPYGRFSPAWDSISGNEKGGPVLVSPVFIEQTLKQQVRHLIFLLCQFVNHMEVTYLPVYCPSKQERDDPLLYAENVRRLMGLVGNLTLSDSGLTEKRIYHAALNGVIS